MIRWRRKLSQPNITYSSRRDHKFVFGLDKSLGKEASGGRKTAKLGEIFLSPPMPRRLSQLQNRSQALRRRVWTANVVALAALALFAAAMAYFIPLGSDATARLVLVTVVTAVICLTTWQEWNTIVSGTKGYLITLGVGVAVTVVSIVVVVSVEGINVDLLLQGDAGAWGRVGDIIGVGRWAYGPMIVCAALASLVREAMLFLLRNDPIPSISKHARSVRR